MPKSEFRTISLPHSYYRKIEEHIEQSNGYYVSIAEVVREALRDYFADKRQLPRAYQEVSKRCRSSQSY